MAENNRLPAVHSGIPLVKRRSLKFWRRLGFTALTIGLVLIGLIVYSMLFAYR